MKRKNVIIDEALLEKARLATGERTFSATVNRALQDVVRRHNFKTSLAELQEDVAKGDFWDRDYVEQMWPEVAEKMWPKRKMSADEKRLPTKGRKR